MEKIFDIAVVGAGPSGLAAAIKAKRTGALCKSSADRKDAGRGKRSLVRQVMAEVIYRTETVIPATGFSNFFHRQE